MEELRQRLDRLDLHRKYINDWAVIDCIFTSDKILREISIDVYPAAFAIPLTFAVQSPHLSDVMYASALHGIRSDEGRTRMEYLKALFVDLIKKNVSSRVVFARDETQRRYIRSLLYSWGFTECSVLDIRTFGCPPVRSSVSKWCGNHGSRFVANTTWICTMSSTEIMSSWLREHAERLYIGCA